MNIDQQQPRSASRRDVLIGGAGAVIAAAASTAMAPSAALAQSTAQEAPRSAKEVRGATPYLSVENEPPPKLIVDPPLASGLALGIVWIQYRVENVRILQVFGAGALTVSPRVGHLHIRVDDLPWLWADASDLNTVDIAGLPPGEHKVKIELVDANHQVFPGQSKTVTFTVPEYRGAKAHSKALQ